MARNDDEPTAQTVSDRIVQLRRGAGPVIWPSVKALLFAGAASTVIAIEYALLKGVLDAVFPPVAGIPDQAIGNGLMAASFVAVVTASYLILSRAGQRVARLLDRAGLAAIALYLAGSGILIASGVSASGLLGVADASLVANGGWNSDLPQGAPDTLADVIASIGMLGLAGAFSALGTLSLIAVHGSITRVRSYASEISSSLKDRREAAALQCEYDSIAAGEARMESAMKRLANERVIASRTTAIEVSTLIAPPLVATSSLVTQLDLSGDEAASLPNDLLHELAGYDREMIRQRVERLRTQSQVEALETLIDRLFQPQTRSFQGGRTCNVCR